MLSDGYIIYQTEIFSEISFLVKNGWLITFWTGLYNSGFAISWTCFILRGALLCSSYTVTIDLGFSDLD